MGWLTDLAIKETEEWGEWYEKKIQKIQECSAPLAELAEAVEDLVKKEQVTMDYESIRINMEDIPTARYLSGKLLDWFPEIQKFTKQGRNDIIASKFIWLYRAEYKGVIIEILPCEPSEDCKVVEKVNTYRSFSCEKQT